MERDLIPDLQSALIALDASNYDQWVAVGAALAPLGDVGFRLWDDWSRTGDGYCEMDALRKWRSFRNSRSHPKAVFTYARKSGWSGAKTAFSQPKRSPPQTPASNQKSRTTADLGYWTRIWAQTISLLDAKAEPAHRYLEARDMGAILEDLPSSLRFHPALRHPEHGETPALVARIEDANGQLCGLHRTFLDGRGGKLDKLTLGRRPAGSAVRLYPWTPGHPLAIAEGIETALAVRLGSDWLTATPNVWCMVAADGLARFTPPEGVSRLDIWADRDQSEAGIRAARELQRRVPGVRILCPTAEQEEAVFRFRGQPQKSVDWLDLFSLEGLT